MALLTLRTHAKKLQLVCHMGKSVLACDFFLKSGRETFIDFHHAAALATDEMMMVAILTFADQLKSSRSIAKIKSLNHAH